MLETDRNMLGKCKCCYIPLYMSYLHRKKVSSLYKLSLSTTTEATPVLSGINTRMNNTLPARYHRPGYEHTLLKLVLSDNETYLKSYTVVVIAIEISALDKYVECVFVAYV